MSQLMSDIQELLQKIGMSNVCLADLIHDGSTVDDPEVPRQLKKYKIMETLAQSLRDAKAALEALMAD